MHHLRQVATGSHRDPATGDKYVCAGPVGQAFVRVLLESLTAQ